MRTSVIAICLLLASGCGSDKRYGDGDGESAGLGDGGSDDDGGGSDEDDGDDDDDGADDEDDRGAAVRGRVWVELYTEDAAGDRLFLSWEDAMGEGATFPFGSIFVAAFDEVDEDKTYFDQDTILRPSVDGDYYSLDIDPTKTEHVNVYATLDIRGDGILGTGEPIGVYGDDIQIRRGTEADDVDIAILVNWGQWGPGGSGWGWGGGGGSGSGGMGGGGGGSGGGEVCPDVTLSGEVDITIPYGGGNGMAMLLDLEGHGPYLYQPFVPIATPDGAESEFGMMAPCHVGAYQLVGAYDSNGNSLIDPMDQWGAYAESPGVNGNPITIADLDLTGHDMEIPLDDGESSLSVVPFVRISGSLFPFDGGTLDAYGEVARIYVVAMKYRMTVDSSVASFEDAYDVETFLAEDVVGLESVDWELIVPANTRVYLWAFVDVDGDGLINEVDEPVASGGVESSGALPVGEDPHAGIPLGVRIATD
jgi:hypothetical protein